MSFFNRFIREPVLHFLVAGILLYCAVLAVRGPELAPADENTITVDRQALLNFMQFRANAFDPEAFAAALDSMSDQEMQRHIDDYITEEVLYREARALNLDQSDYIIRQRMVQKMQFLLGDLAGGEAGIEEEELVTYFNDNREVWRVSPSATLTHVYFDIARRGEEQARLDAEALKAAFNERGVGFNDTEGEGDRFPFLKNYVERTFDYLEGQFGTEFVAALESTQPSDQWQGPIRSVFGWHLVLLTDRQEARYPALEEVREIVEIDFIRERSEQQLLEITETVKNRYDVEVDEAIRETQP